MKPEELIAKARAQKNGIWPTRDEIAKEAARLAYLDAAETVLISNLDHVMTARALRSKAAEYGEPQP